MKKFVPCFIVLLFCFFSCKKKTVMEEDIQAEFLVAEEIIASHILYPSFFTIKNNYLFEATYNQEKLINVYELPQLNLINSIFTKGPGPDEFQLFPMFCESSDPYLYLWGFDGITIKKYTPHNGKLEYEKEFKLKDYESFNQMHIFRDSILIYNAMPNEYAIKKYDLVNKEFIKTIKLGDTNKDSMNKYFGYIAANEEVIVHVYLYQNKIDLYSSKNMKLIKSIKNEDFQPNIDLMQNEGIKYNIDVIPRKNHFYVLFQGCTDNEYKVNSNTIKVYDYSGILKTKFSFNISPSIFFVDESEEYLYGYNDQYNENVLLRFKLPSN